MTKFWSPVYGGPLEAKNNALEGLVNVGKALDPDLSDKSVEVLKNFVEKTQKGSGSALPLLCKGNSCVFIHVCQPPGTLVYTSNRGEIPIEKLNPETDLIISYSFRQFSDISSRREGVKTLGTKFKKQKLYYDGDLVNISTDHHSHKTTLSHASIIRWNNNAKSKFIVYLMRRGKYFRVGKTKLILERNNSPSACGLVGRAQQQDADAAWILGVYENNAEAVLGEEKFSLYFQAPKAQFIVQESAKKQKYDGLYKWATNEMMDKHFEECYKLLPENNFRTRLKELGLSIDLPFWEKPDRENNKNTSSMGSTVRSFQVVGYNLLSDIMSVAVYDSNIDSCKDQPSWKPIKVTREPYQGDVYNLEVDIDHTYIANRIITHNCPLKAASIPLPVGARCPAELSLVSLWVNKHLKALGIEDIDSPENSFDMDMLYELATQELIRYRCFAYLSKNPEIVENKMIGESFNGTPIFADVMNPVMEAMDKAGRNISKIREALLATRKAQVTAGQVILDSTEKAANLRAKARDLINNRLKASKEDIQDASFKLINEPNKQNPQ